MSEAHELGDVIHQRHVEVLASGEEGEAMLLAVGTELPFLDLFIIRVRLHTAEQSLRVADDLFESAEVMIGGVKRMFHLSCLVVTPLDIAWFLVIQ